MKLNNSKFAGQDAGDGDEWFDKISDVSLWWEQWAAFHREARHNFSPSADRIIHMTAWSSPRYTHLDQRLLVKTSKELVDLVKGNNGLMKQQCNLWQVVAENQQKLAAIMKGVVEPPKTLPGSGPPPSGMRPPLTPATPPVAMPHSRHCSTFSCVCLVGH